ncbi:hypothetical protein [Intestinibacter sp.]|uniref:hypothetical protein n=1 Tax=Intestinibacter sp. TaxID=1965304 RepID=UPI003F172FE8
MKEDFNVIKLSLDRATYQIVRNKVTICKCFFRIPADIVQLAYDTQYSKQILGIVRGIVNTSSNSYFTLYSEGYAYCHSKDAFNEKTGKSIAFARACISAHRKFLAILNMVEAALYLKNCKVSDNQRREFRIIENEVNYLNSLINKESN